MEAVDNHINYVEFHAIDLIKIKAFYTKAFGWTFTDYGPTYAAFSDSGLQGGFDSDAGAVASGALIVLYHSKLEEIRDQIIAAGGTISKAIFSFPGGRRFHFKDPSQNELAVWSDS